MAIGIPHYDIDRSWMKVSPMIESVLTRFPSGWEIEDIRTCLEERDMQLWADNPDDIKLVAITRIVIHPNSKTCWIWLCSGDMGEKFFNHILDIENWAKEIGCDEIALQGRKGWERKLKGWGQEQVLIKKKLEQKDDTKIH